MIHTTLSHFTDDKLLRHVENERDPLTSTDAEVELVQRFTNLLDEQAANAKRIEILDDHGFEDDADLEKSLALFNEFEALDIRSLLEAITAAGIDNAEQLKARLAIADQFDGIASDAGDLFTRLESLIATTQE